MMEGPPHIPFNLPVIRRFIDSISAFSPIFFGLKFSGRTLLLSAFVGKLKVGLSCSLWRAWLKTVPSPFFRFVTDFESRFPCGQCVISWDFSSPAA